MIFPLKAAKQWHQAIHSHAPASGCCRSSCFGGSGLSFWLISIDFSDSLESPGAELGWWIYGSNFHEFHRNLTRTRVSWVSLVRELTCWARAKVEVPQTSVMCQRMPRWDGVWPEFLASAVILHDSSVFFAQKHGYGSIPRYIFSGMTVGWTSIYQLFWGSLGTRVLTHPHISRCQKHQPEAKKPPDCQIQMDFEVFLGGFFHPGPGRHPPHPRLTLPPSRGIALPQVVGQVQLWRQDSIAGKYPTKNGGMAMGH